MRTIVLGIGDLFASNTAGDTLRTHALGSCVAIILVAPVTRTIAMAHVALPDSSISPEKGKAQPGYFADTAFPALLNAIARTGWAGGSRGLVAKLVGGAQVNDPNNVFNIGKRNLIAIKELLKQAGIEARAEDVAGNISRTVTVDVDGQVVLVTSPRRQPLEL